MTVAGIEAPETEVQQAGKTQQTKRRARARKPCSGEATIEIPQSDGGNQIVKGKLIDISDYGVGLETASPLTVGQVVTISSRFFDAQAAEPQRRQARVTHCRLRDDNVYRSGFAFEDDPSGQDRSSDRTPPSVEGSFADYYEILQVSPTADLETIHRVYRMLAQRYHPDNQESGNEEAFRLTLQAYRVLADPEKRAPYDVKYKSQRALQWHIFQHDGEAGGVEEEQHARWGILAALCSMRRQQPTRPGMSVRELENLLGCPREHLEFSLWYLKGKSQVESADHGRYVITPAGVDALEENGELRPDPQRPLLTAPQPD